MRRSIELAGGALQAIEFVVFVGAAIALVAIGPLIWIRRLLIADQLVLAVVVVILWLGSVIGVAREVRRRAITVVSFGIFLAWLVVLVWVFRDWIF
jgi:hypothetical protein